MKIILYAKLHKLIGRKSDAVKGILGINVIFVLLRKKGKVPEMRKALTKVTMYGPITLQVF